LNGKQKEYRSSDHSINKKHIDPDALKVIHRLKKSGFTVYLTGAAVQNLLQDIPPKDFDLVTNARPGQIKRRFSNAYLIGKRFRLVHIHFRDGKYIEVATFRRASDILDKHGPDLGEKRKQTYGTPREDAFRRDISINALYYDVGSASVIDYVQGLKDLAERRIRVIGNPKERYTEDPVRILRVVRHAARLGFNIEKRTEEAIYSCRHLLTKCPDARLFEEFNKDLSTKSLPIIKAYNRYGILKYLFGRVGEEYQADHVMFSQLMSILEFKDRASSEGFKYSLDELYSMLKDRASSGGFKYSLDELYSMLLWPWVERHFVNEKGNIQKILNEAIITTMSMSTLPRKIRTSLIHILILLRNLSKTSQGNKSFESLFRQAVRFNRNRQKPSRSHPRLNN
jgi:poly(A) polymerase